VSRQDEKIVRCRFCGHALLELRPVSDSETGMRFFSQRCKACNEMNVVREDNMPPRERG
jgi:phage FluMu protein Com